MNLADMGLKMHAERLAMYGTNMSPSWMATTGTSAAYRSSNPELYIPATPVQPSKIRKHGLAIWDLMSMCRSTAEANKISKETPILSRVRPRKPSPTNWPWLDPRGMNERSRYSFSHKDDVVIPYYLDLSREDTHEPFRLYELAHHLMHAWGDPVAVTSGVAFRPYVYSKFLSLAMAHLLVSKEFGFPIYIGDGSFDRGWIPPSPYGLAINVSNRMLSPMFGVPADEVMSRDRVDNTVAYVFVSVHVYPSPELFTSAVPMTDLIWSMGPMRVQIVGWEFIDFVFNGPLVCKSTVSNKKVVGVHPNDLLPPELLGEYKDLVFPGWREFEREYEGVHSPNWATYDELMRYDSLYYRLRVRMHPLPFPPALNMASLKVQASNSKEEEMLRKKALRLVRKATVVYEKAISRKIGEVWVGRTARKALWFSRMKDLKTNYRKIKRDKL